MESRKYWIVGGIGALLLAGLIYWGATEESGEVSDTPGIVYFYGEECPHCKDLQKFIDENGIAEKVTFTKKEVWHNKDNAREMDRRAKTCDPKPAGGMGVPFVYDGDTGKCSIGTPEAMKFFKEKAGIES